ncbi:MAG: hypothetical protein HZA81_03460 [Candidatus Taylorbacteria bacterium]|nr:hypothetical protein [Candidatus Taylorbacteria bacterium]
MERVAICIQQLYERLQRLRRMFRRVERRFLHELHRELGDVSCHLLGRVYLVYVLERGMDRDAGGLQLLLSELQVLLRFGRLRYDRAWRILHDLFFDRSVGSLMFYGCTHLHL